jgi:O-antigen biosynthesis protein
MKLFLIKIGKAFVAIKRDGLIVGGYRVLGYLGTFAKTILNSSSGDILIITGGVGDSANYRSYNVAEELNLHKINAAVMIQDNPFLPRFADKFKVFIFHRTLVTPIITKLIKRIKEQKKEIIFDTDDLVFDTKYMHAADSYANMSYFEKKQYEHGVGEEILTDAYVRVCTTSTTYIAKILKEYEKRVFIVPNKLSKLDLEIAENILKNSRKEKNEIVRVGYFSGTMSHNRDFAAITDVLLQIMEKYMSVELFLAGPLDIESRLNKFKERIKQLPYVPRAKHFANIATVDINIAPLEVGNPFCEAKSELKFFEAGILGIPTVASATQTFKEAIQDGEDGFVAASDVEWIEKIGKLITDKNLRGTMGSKAREKSLQKYTNKNSLNEEYYNYLKSKL